MKKLILLSIFALICISGVEQQKERISIPQELIEQSTAFCEGWDDGYVAGYCYRKVGCIEPITPLCPIPEINESSYEDGYNRGFLNGQADQ